MRLTRAEQANVIELYHKRGTQVAMTECLTIWKQHNPNYAATYGALLELLQEKIADEITNVYTPCTMQAYHLGGGGIHAALLSMQVYSDQTDTDCIHNIVVQEV